VFCPASARGEMPSAASVVTRLRCGNADDSAFDATTVALDALTLALGILLPEDVATGPPLTITPHPRESVRGMIVWVRGVPAERGDGWW
jgi:hypothetical protein